VNIRQGYPDQTDKGTKRTKNPPHYTSKHQVWKQCMLLLLLPVSLWW